MGNGGILPTLGSAQDFLPIDTPCTIHTQHDLDTDMEDETGPVQSKTNKKRVLLKLKESSSSVRRENVKYEASSGKDLARALAKMSPGGMSEFVQSVPVHFAGSLMRFAAQSAPFRLWPTEFDTQDEVSNGVGQQPSRHVGSASRSLSGNQANKVVFNGSLPQSAKPGLFLQENPPLFFKDLQVLCQVLCCVAGMGMVEAGVGVLFSRLLVLCLLGRLLSCCWWNWADVCWIRDRFARCAVWWFRACGGD